MSDIPIDPTTPGLRLLDLLDLLVREARPLSLPEAVAACGWPKPTVHRMLAQLEAGGWLQREPDGRRYGLASRLLRLGEGALGASTQHGVRHAVLRQLVADIGESCNLTALSGAEVVYLDRVESAFPLRLELRPGTRVPLHCSASGKLFLAHLHAARRQALLDNLTLSRHTAATLTEREALDAELATIRRQGHAFDAEEFVDGLVCIAVPVRASGERAVRCALALQAPSARVSLADLPQFLPRLTQAAQALARTL
ncbi:MAG: IclR family transcriptional regulator [Hydrogenophaga sp.]|uniref:IclR family transcriptional regulator n=1 Tax=Hydrogenophaga sp. TaxID=1904254 RepID=UPI001DADA998|nr:IclR family transcriptional regulator [Hydrogenophaga sp.]MBX3608746.1 IclR family transcriptional regulator [Hydrogenophaga sp.]